MSPWPGLLFFFSLVLTCGKCWRFECTLQVEMAKHHGSWYVFSVGCMQYTKAWHRKEFTPAFQNSAPTHVFFSFFLFLTIFPLIRIFDDALHYSLVLEMVPYNSCPMPSIYRIASRTRMR